MLARLTRWLRGQPSEPDVRPDPVALDVMRRQQRVARRLSRFTDATPEELLDYRRTDRLFEGRR